MITIRQQGKDGTLTDVRIFALGEVPEDDRADMYADLFGTDNQGDTP